MAPKNVIALGRAYVRLIEAAEVIAGYSENDEEAQRLRELAAEYRQGLRQLIDTVDPHVVAEILAASEKVLGPVNELGRN